MPSTRSGSISKASWASISRSSEEVFLDRPHGSGSRTRAAPTERSCKAGTAEGASVRSRGESRRTWKDLSPQPWKSGARSSSRRSRLCWVGSEALLAPPYWSVSRFHSPTLDPDAVLPDLGRGKPLRDAQLTDDLICHWTRWRKPRAVGLLKSPGLWLTNRQASGRANESRMRARPAEGHKPLALHKLRHIRP